LARLHAIPINADPRLVCGDRVKVAGCLLNVFWRS
jgi:hypothetical protein